MSNPILKLSARIQNLMLSEDGQDVIEYALVIAFVAFAATAGMTSLATAVNNAFGTLGTDLSNAI
jgi:pilus assembly protein Flp/PilA